MSSPLPSKQSSWCEILLPEQRQALEFVCSRPACGLFSEQGTGKTYITLAMLERLKPQYVLIVAPLTSLDITWAPRLATLNYYKIVRSWAEFKNWRRHYPDSPIVLLIHFQAFTKFAKSMAKFSWSQVIIDESQGLKARASGWSRSAKRFRAKARRLCLSGTPLDKSPIDVWAQMRFIEPTVLSERFTDFGERFCYKGGFMGKKWIFRSAKLPTFLRLLEPYIFRLTKSFMQLKPIQVHLVPVKLLGAQRRIYDMMQEHSIVPELRLRADLPITQKVKLEQITGGAVLIGDDRELVQVGRAKERKLRHLVPQLLKPVVVFCKFLHEIPIIQSALRHSAVSFNTIRYLTGKIKDDKRDKTRTNLINGFQAGKIDALVCQLRTGGVSIEFTRASHLVFYSMNHSYIDFEQIMSRVHRGGQTEEVHVWVIYAEGTVDEGIIDTIEEKRSTAYQVVSHFERSNAMAEKKKKSANKKSAKKVPAESNLRFNISHVAQELGGITPQSARVSLRKAKVRKTGKSYGWASREAMLKDIKPLTTARKAA